VVEIQRFGSGALDELEAKRVFAAFGVPCVREIAVTDGAQAAAAARQLGGRLVLKLLDGDITHKSDVGGVAVDVPAAEVAARLEAMAREVQARTGSRPARFLVQAMVSGGIELIIGLHRDAIGAAVLVGMGGVTAELMDDTVLCLLPEAGGLGEAQALALVQGLKSWPLLNGYRGRPPADVAALTAAIVAFSRMAVQLGDAVVAAEINPLFVMTEGRGVAAADGILVLARG
jgi:succinyl-CoA synthetase beta subunit